LIPQLLANLLQVAADSGLVHPKPLCYLVLREPLAIKRYHLGPARLDLDLHIAFLLRHGFGIINPCLKELIWREIERDELVL
jgi:hypothetical protein